MFPLAFTELLPIYDFSFELELFADLHHQEFIEISCAFDLYRLGRFFWRDSFYFNPVIAKPPIRALCARGMPHDPKFDFCVKLAEFAPDLKVPASSFFILLRGSYEVLEYPYYGKA